ncbi:hypothetical protein FGK63_03545 [Ruegeria sediminis]|uniref:Flagellar motor switch protein FliN n=1 Tax=Ruegeria sediminis TaxID=2583820 RepID=A0ABY2X425_9RHOB|nr:hypothetical protein [Ruegeria sediminis]TMV10147.1 hypothetical protein FGK63_03545 [Ruegeria sediminis]
MESPGHELDEQAVDNAISAILGGEPGESEEEPAPSFLMDAPVSDDEEPEPVSETVGEPGIATAISEVLRHKWQALSLRL